MLLYTSDLGEGWRETRPPGETGYGYSLSDNYTAASDYDTEGRRKNHRGPVSLASHYSRTPLLASK